MRVPTRSRVLHSLRSAAGRTLIACTLAGATTGCAGLEVSRINSAQDKPNNVWVFFTVEDGGDPVAGLEAEDFQIYEDDQLVSQFESKQVIQNPEVAAVMYTLLLMDMSGSVTESGETDHLVDSAKLFSEQVGKSQKVAVYAFDGSEEIYSVVSFTEAQGSVEGGLEGLRSYQPKDPSTNLNGAVTLGLQELKTALDKDDRPLKFGTLVVFTDGTDRAARVTREELQEEMAKEEYDHYEIFAIGVGAEITEDNLAQIGRDGTELASEPGQVQEAFERVADTIEAHMKRFYLLSYCSPARKGEHLVRIEAHRDKSKGALEYNFDAENFGPPPDCDPNRKPSFSLEDTVPAADEDDEPSRKSRGRAGGSSKSKSKGKGSTTKKKKLGSPSPPGG